MTRFSANLGILASDATNIRYYSILPPPPGQACNENQAPALVLNSTNQKSQVTSSQPGFLPKGMLIFTLIVLKMLS